MGLLGLVETRHGKRTFLSDYRSYDSVEVLSSFILREANTRSNLLFAKKIIDKEAAKMAFKHIQQDDIIELSAIISDYTLESQEKHAAFFQCLFLRTETLLLTKIWQLMDKFLQTPPFVLLGIY